MLSFPFSLKSKGKIFNNVENFASLLDSVIEYNSNNDFIGKRYNAKNDGLPDDLKVDRSIFQKPVYSLVIPAYNEEERIVPFLTAVKKNLTDFAEIIIVCDGNDNTSKIAKKIDSRFIVFTFPHRLGKGGAIMEGFKYASGDVIGYVDADGSVSPNEVRKVFEAVTPLNEVSVGSRWVDGSKISIKQPLIRIVLGRLYHYLSFAILGLRTKDTQCGIKAFKSELLAKLSNKVIITNLSFDTAILYHSKKIGSNIIEVPITWQDVGGSKVKPVRTSIVMFLSLVGLRLAHSSKSENLSTLLSTVSRFVNSL